MPNTMHCSHACRSRKLSTAFILVPKPDFLPLSLLSGLLKFTASLCCEIFVAMAASLGRFQVLYHNLYLNSISQMLLNA